MSDCYGGQQQFDGAQSLLILASSIHPNTYLTFSSLYPLKGKSLRESRGGSFGFLNWEEVVEFARSEEGAHLLTFVNLVESLGERRLLWALGRTVDEGRANLMISTGHKAKGREWKSVRLLDDFMRSTPTASNRENPGPDPAELRLLYVALTRAKAALQVPDSLLSLINNTEGAARLPKPGRDGGSR